MSKSKSVFVAVLVALMLAAIILGLYQMQSRIWKALAGLLCLYGYLCGTVHFSRWMRQEVPMLPAGRGYDGRDPSTALRSAQDDTRDEEEQTAAAGIHSREEEQQEQPSIWSADEAWTKQYSAIKAELEEEEQI